MPNVLRRFLCVCTLCGLFCLTGGTSAAQPRDITVAAPPEGLLALPAYRMVDIQPLADRGVRIVFTPWKNPDQLRALVAGGTVDFVGMHTNLAANFHNRGLNVCMLNVTLWKVLYIVTDDPEVRRFEDLRGREVLVPFKGFLPDILFNRTARGLGLEPGHDFDIRYVGSTIDAAQLMLLGRARCAVLAEPSCSTALYNARHPEPETDPPTLYRSIDLQAEWGRAFEQEPRIALAGVAVMPSVADDAELLSAFHAAWSEAAQWCLRNPEDAGELATRSGGGRHPEAVAMSLGTGALDVTDAVTARAAMEDFFSVLQDENPAMTGGGMPGEAFYWGPEPTQDGQTTEQDPHRAE